MENLGITLIMCGIMAAWFGMMLMCGGNLNVYTTSKGIGVGFFLLGLLSIYVGIALLVSLWMLIIVPVIAVLLIFVPESNCR